MDAELVSRLLALGIPEKHMCRVLSVLAEHQPAKTVTPEAMRKRRERDRKRDMSRTSHGTVADDVTGQVTSLPSPPLPPSPLSPSPPIPTPTHAPTPTLSSAPARKEPDFALDDQQQASPAKRFVAPTLADWQAYGAALIPAYPGQEAENTWNFYQSKGWKVGNQTMKDWRAALRTCHGRWKQGGPSPPAAKHKPRHAAYNAETHTAGMSGKDIGEFTPDQR